MKNTISRHQLCFVSDTVGQTLVTADKSAILSVYVRRKPNTSEPTWRPQALLGAGRKYNVGVGVTPD